jgi:predicted RNA-binding protein with RPS1 domain
LWHPSIAHPGPRRRDGPPVNVGDRLSAKVQRVTFSGAFVELEGGRGQAYLPVTELEGAGDAAGAPNAKELLQPNQMLDVVVTRSEDGKVDVSTKTSEQVEEDRSLVQEGVFIGEPAGGLTMLAYALKSKGITKQLYATPAEKVGGCVSFMVGTPRHGVCVRACVCGAMLCESSWRRWKK